MDTLFMTGFVGELEKIAEKKDKSWIQKHWKKIGLGGLATAAAGGLYKGRRMQLAGRKRLAESKSLISQIGKNRAKIEKGWSDIEKVKIKQPRKFTPKILREPLEKGKKIEI